MKKIITIISLFLLIGILSSCAGCSSCKKKLETVSGGHLYDKKNDVVYNVAPQNYEAAAWGPEAYVFDKKGIGYHKVRDINGNFADPSMWLYNYDNNILLYNSSIDLPSLSEMDADRLSFYVEENSRVYLVEEKNKDNVKKVLELLSGSYCFYSGDSSSERYKISFTSTKYPYISYHLNYLEYEKDQIEYVSLKNKSFSSVDDVKENYEFKPGIPYEILSEKDGCFTVAYNFGKYLIFDRETGRCYSAGFIHETYNGDTEEDGGAV